MRRATTVLVISLLTTGGLLTLAPSASADITAEPLTITVTGPGPEHRTCAVDADLYVPAGVTAAHPAPAVLGAQPVGAGGATTPQPVTLTTSGTRVQKLTVPTA